jgi:hypothetical protein
MASTQTYHQTNVVNCATGLADKPVMELLLSTDLILSGELHFKAIPTRRGEELQIIQCTGHSLDFKYVFFRITALMSLQICW